MSLVKHWPRHRPIQEPWPCNSWQLPSDVEAHACTAIYIAVGSTANVIDRLVVMVVESTVFLHLQVRTFEWSDGRTGSWLALFSGSRRKRCCCRWKFTAHRLELFRLWIVTDRLSPNSKACKSWDWVAANENGNDNTYHIRPTTPIIEDQK